MALASTYHQPAAVLDLVKDARCAPPAAVTFGHP
jgi:hypothetical protein